MMARNQAFIHAIIQKASLEFLLVSYNETEVLKWNSKFPLKCQTLDQTRGKEYCSSRVMPRVAGTKCS